MEPHIVYPATVQPPMVVAMPTPVSMNPDSSWPLRLLGSTADSPPQSVTDSPSPSPTNMYFDSAFDVFPGLISAIPFQTINGNL